MSVRDREDAVVARLHELAPHLDGEPDPAFRAATRARLVAMAAVRTPEPEPVSGPKRLLAAGSAPARWRARLTAGLAGAATAVTALATLVALSTDARPGDVLYGLKRGTEQTQLALAGDARGQTLLDFAATRLDELEDLVADGPPAMSTTPAGPAEGTVPAAGADAGLLLDTLRTMDDQTTQGAAWLTRRSVTTDDSDPLDDLAVWAEEQSAGLVALAPRFPGETAEAAQASLALLSDVTTRVTGLRSAIGCESGPAVDGADALGPVPGPCTPEQGSAPPGGSGTATPTAPVPGGPPTTGAPHTVPSPGGSAGSGGSTAGSGPGGVEVPPTDLPSPPGPLPPLPTVPGAQTGGGTPSGPMVDVPSAPVTLCLPPLATIGDC